MLDLFIVVVLAIGVARGFATGAVRQAASILGLVVSVVLAVQLMGAVGRVAAASLGISDRVAPLVGFVLVLLVVQIAMFALVRMIESVLGALKLSVINRAAGGVIGAAKAALFLSVLFLVMGYFRLPGPESRSASSLYPPVAAFLPVAWDAVAQAFPRVEGLSRRFGDEVLDQLSEDPE